MCERRGAEWIMCAAARRRLAWELRPVQLALFLRQPVIRARRKQPAAPEPDPPRLPFEEVNPEAAPGG